MLPLVVTVLAGQLHGQCVQQHSPLPPLDLLQVQVLQSRDVHGHFRIVRGVLGGPIGKHVDMSGAY